MRSVAVLSDVHGNVPALGAVLAERHRAVISALVGRWRRPLSCWPDP
ncbi:hypothetical protein ACFFX1_07835 [Dactylosporangium sucinum]|nr:hypothetical protein [Dactylosporangium sucinum]